MLSCPLTFITKDDNKVHQIENNLRPHFDLQLLFDKLREYQGPERDVLSQKCKEAVALNFPCPVATDLTSVHFNALNGLPGSLIASFDEKLNSSEYVKLLEGWEDKSAYVLYSVGLMMTRDDQVKIFQGFITGNIVEPKDPSAVGWEFCFQPDGYTVTYAELPQNVRNEISERSKALRSLKTHIISEDCSNTFYECF